MPSDIANTYRFFVSPDVFQAGSDQVVLTDSDLVHQLSRVLRLEAGDRVLLLDGRGSAYEVVLTEVSRRQAVGRVERSLAAGGEPSFDVVLYVALFRLERFEWVLQKGTELGVRRFVPVVFARSLPSDRVSHQKQTRWKKIVREAAEQSCRGLVPEMSEPYEVAQACREAAGASLALMLWEGDHESGQFPPLLRAVLRERGDVPGSLAVLSGPEGGIAPEELTTATGHGIIPVSFGSRILRAETAPIAAVAALFYELEG